MAKIIPVTMTVREFMRQRSRWSTMSELCRMHGLSNDALNYRIRRYKGKIELLKVRSDYQRFKTMLYKRSHVWCAIHSFKFKNKSHMEKPGKVYVTAKEAAQLLGFATACSFSTWKNKCERKPESAYRWQEYPTGKARFVVVYELESVYECRNWFMQRKRCVDRLPSLSDTTSWSYDARRAGREVWEHMGYSNYYE